MTINFKKNADQTVVEVSGRLDTTTAPALEKALADEVTENSSLVLDLSELSYISSAGLRVLLGTQKRMQKSGSVKLIGVREEIMEIFEMTGFADILTIEQ